MAHQPFFTIHAQRAHSSAARTDSLNTSLRRNIEALRRRRAREEADAGVEERLAGAITRFSGSMRFVYFHALVYGFWIVANVGWLPHVKAWDPTFVVLAMVTSVEAIFLSTFILITQNRMALAADRRAELDVQISLLAEAEITKLVEMVSEIADRMNLPAAEQEEVEEMKRQVAPEAGSTLLKRAGPARPVQLLDFRRSAPSARIRQVSHRSREQQNLQQAWRARSVLLP